MKYLFQLLTFWSYEFTFSINASVHRKRFLNMPDADFERGISGKADVAVRCAMVYRNSVPFSYTLRFKVMILPFLLGTNRPFERKPLLLAAYDI